MSNTTRYPAFEDTGTIKKRTRALVIIAVALTVVWAACISTILVYSLANGFIDDDPDFSNGDKEKDPPKVYTTDDYNYAGVITDAMKNAINSSSEDYLILINKSNPVGEDFTVSSLKTLDTQYTTGKKSIQLEMNAALAAEALMAEMRACGFDEITITSAYRSYSYQKSLFDKYFAEEKAANPNLSDAKIKEIVLGYSAEPGYSEHHSGLCLDFITSGMNDLYNYGSETPNNSADRGFAETEEYQWLLENAHRFGFILRYPENKVNETKYNYESWHFRFVGIDAATKIHNKGITLESYVK